MIIIQIQTSSLKLDQTSKVKKSSNIGKKIIVSLNHLPVLFKIENKMKSFSSLKYGQDSSSSLKV